MIEEDGKLYLLFDRFWGPGDYRDDVIPFDDILGGKTGPSLEGTMIRRYAPFH